MTQLPTVEQYRRFRANRRKHVRQLVECVKGGVVPFTPWAAGVLHRARKEHTESIARQRRHGAAA